MVFVVICECLWFVFYFFFFKQKTAYEMRISDWSSDVCSSDLAGLPRRGGDEAGDRPRRPRRAERQLRHRQGDPAARRETGDRRDPRAARCESVAGTVDRGPHRQHRRCGPQPFAVGGPRARRGRRPGRARSEEHTSELQSLMRISYAVFCLKKKKNEQ